MSRVGPLRGLRPVFLAVQGTWAISPLEVAGASNARKGLLEPLGALLSLE
nr:MAG TPA: hypothetical protein [Caudoviricetes sp.]